MASKGHPAYGHNRFAETVEYGLNQNDPGVQGKISTLNWELANQRRLEQWRQENLPGYNKNKAPINWLGSSYSGADLKIVAHLYDPIKDGDSRIETRLQRIKNQIEYNNALGNSAGNLSTNIASIASTSQNWTQKSNAFRRIISNVNRVYADEIYNQLIETLRFVNTASPRGLAQGIIELNKIEESAYQLAESLEKELTREEQLATQGTQTVVLGTLQTISVQSYREKHAVRALGQSYAKGYTRGTRTIAGSMIFTIFDEHAFAHLLRSMGKSDYFKSIDEQISTLLPDQMPPIDLTLAFANEYGSTSRMGLYGVEFLTDSYTFSIEDLLSENVINFVARDVDPMMKTGDIPLSKTQRGQADTNAIVDSATNRALNDENYQQYLHRLKVRRRLNNR